MAMKLSVVIPTKNEEVNIGACLDAFAPFGHGIEILVVDNFSPDRTREIADKKGANVLLKGLERCAQRNRGWREATGDYVMFVDADMIVPKATVEEILEGIREQSTAVDAYWIPEVRSGAGLRLKARNFERSFYDGTCIDGLRVIRRDWLEKVGGYDENLVACEDWDLDRRLLAAGATTAITKGHLVHNEAKQDLGKFLKKKAYYSTSVAAYRAKWREDDVIRKQFGLGYRFLGVFVEHGQWRKLLRHPVLAAVMYAERVLVGFTYLLNREREVKG